MMKLALLALVLAPLSAHADPARFTTVFLDDDGEVYVGVKHGAPAVSEVISFPFASGERTIVPLPSEIRSRAATATPAASSSSISCTSACGESTTP